MFENYASYSPVEMGVVEGLYLLTGWDNFKYISRVTPEDDRIILFKLEGRSNKNHRLFGRSFYIFPGKHAICNLTSLNCTSLTSNNHDSALKLKQIEKSRVLSKLISFNEAGKLSLH